MPPFFYVCTVFAEEGGKINGKITDEEIIWMLTEENRNKAVDTLFNDALIQNSAQFYINKFYKRFGMDEYTPAYQNFKKEELMTEVFLGVEDALEAMTVEEFFAKRGKRSNHQVLASYVKMYIKGRICTRIMTEVQQFYPELTKYYQEQLILMKRAGVSLEDSAFKVYHETFELHKEERAKRGKAPDFAKGGVAPRTLSRMREIFKEEPDPDREGYFSDDIETAFFNLTKKQIYHVSRHLFKTKAEQKLFNEWFEYALENKGVLPKSCINEAKKQRKLLIKALLQEDVLPENYETLLIPKKKRGDKKNYENDRCNKPVEFKKAA